MFNFSFIFKHDIYKYKFASFILVENVTVSVNDECNSFTTVSWILRGDSVMLSEVNFTIIITDSMGNINRTVNIQANNCVLPEMTCGEHLTEFSYNSIDRLGVNEEYDVSITTSINETNTMYMLLTPVVSITANTIIASEL